MDGEAANNSTKRKRPEDGATTHCRCLRMDTRSSPNDAKYGVLFALAAGTRNSTDFAKDLAQNSAITDLLTAEIRQSGTAETHIQYLLGLKAKGLQIDYALGLALHAAVENNSSAAVELLLKSGADINYRKKCGVLRKDGISFIPTHQGITPLDRAVFEAPDLVKRLLQRRARLDADTWEIFMNFGHISLEDHFRDASASLKMLTSQQKNSLLLGAARRGFEEDKDIDVVLLEAGADPSTRNDKGWTVPIIAAHYGHELILHHILMYCDDNSRPYDLFNAVDHYGRTPLIHASIKGHYNAISTLILNCLVDLKKKDKWGRTALSAAVRSGSLRNVMELLDKLRPEDVYSDKDNNGRSVYYWAKKRAKKCGNANARVMQALLACHCQKNELNGDWRKLAEELCFPSKRTAQDRSADPNWATSV